VAGPEWTPTQLRWATVPDGRYGRGEGGEYQRIEARNRVMLQKQQAAGGLIQPHHPPINILGGYRFPGAPEIGLSATSRPTGATITTTSAVATPINDDLEIPTFLRRVP
jgi:hypothetical protein